MIEQHHWDVLSKQIVEFLDLPGWARGLCEQSVDEIARDNRVRIEVKLFDKSYIQFLQEQIELGVRGDEWTDLLRKRKSALSPWVGRETQFLTITKGPRLLCIRFEPTQLRVIWVEAFD